MEIIIKDDPTPPDEVLEALAHHMPYSLPASRRIQFMKTSAGRQTAHSHILSTFATSVSSSTSSPTPAPEFLIAYLDFSRGPNTEMWLYSSIEHPTIPSSAAVCEAQLLALLKHVAGLEQEYVKLNSVSAPRENQGTVLIASLHVKVWELLQKHSLVKMQSPEHLKFLFKVADLPGVRELPEGLVWASVRAEDIPLVLSRTAIPYKAELMKALPSVAIQTSAGVPIAWAFLGPDGSLKTLHCEEEYRGRGLAKAVSVKLLRDRAVDLVQDGWYHADVAVENLQSQGVCRSLKGTVEWSLYCTCLDPYILDHAKTRDALVYFILKLSGAPFL
ncbi:hypothetical protein LSUB1_G006020 [Lachnellula subtilissima]|uniref:N-acetyltransferase domain-containing protein n=1 Tax=Lachnellula subtilissima TaxID=602034 RepID=A0A8H8U565_9HELO|nr:hypothetical protein LSUB1_G006020 [Lachnellula subtilissima]